MPKTVYQDNDNLLLRSSDMGGGVESVLFLIPNTSAASYSLSFSIFHSFSSKHSLSLFVFFSLHISVHFMHICVVMNAWFVIKDKMGKKERKKEIITKRKTLLP